MYVRGGGDNTNKKWEIKNILIDLFQVLANHQRVTVFDPSDENAEGLDIIILRKVVAQEVSLP